MYMYNLLSIIPIYLESWLRKQWPQMHRVELKLHILLDRLRRCILLGLMQLFNSVFKCATIHLLVPPAAEVMRNMYIK